MHNVGRRKAALVLSSNYIKLYLVVHGNRLGIITTPLDSNRLNEKVQKVTTAKRNIKYQPTFPYGQKPKYGEWPS